MGRWLLYVIALPQALLISYPAVAALWLLRRVHRPRFEGHGVLVATKRTPTRYSQCMLGPGIVLAPHVDDHRPGLHAPVEQHEARHVAQIQVLAFGHVLLAGVLFAFGALSWWGALLVWLFGPVIHFLGAYICGKLESGQWYYGSEFERSAYAQHGTGGDPNEFWFWYSKHWMDPRARDLPPPNIHA